MGKGPSPSVVPWGKGPPPALSHGERAVPQCCPKGKGPFWQMPQRGLAGCPKGVSGGCPKGVSGGVPKSQRGFVRCPKGERMEACAAPSAKLHTDVQNLKYACRLQQLTPVHHLKCFSMCVILCKALPCDCPHSSSTACLTATSR